MIQIKVYDIVPSFNKIITIKNCLNMSTKFANYANRTKT